MKKAVIFDFKRTIYDPELDKLLPGIKGVLKQLKKRGYSLFLISHGSYPKALIRKFELGPYFDEILITENKSSEDFKKIISNNEIDTEISFVIGDRVRGEIKIGNSLGITTIWLRRGLFAEEFPLEPIEEPDFTIRSFREILDCIS